MDLSIVEVSSGNFEEIVIEGSRTRPVLVDFWAPWCAPCRALTPVLERLAGEYSGRFTLAKVNSDENQELASRFGVRGIPNVKAFIGGQLVDEFSGALPEAMVRQFVDRVVPSPAEELRLQARARYGETGAAAEALELLDRALRLDPRSDAARIDSVEILIDLGRLEEAKRLLEGLSPLAQMDERVSALKGRIDFAASAASAPDSQSLKKRIARDPNDLEARLALARLHAAEKDYAAALEELLEIVRRDRSFQDDVARKTMLQIFNLVGQSEPMVSEYRRRLASAMY